MKNRTMMPMAVVGLVAWCVIIGSSFLPWSLWVVEERYGIQIRSTSIWGPPAYDLGLPNIFVKGSAGSLRELNLLVVVNLLYLVLLLFGIGLWLRFVWRSRRKVNWQGLAIVAGVVCFAVGIGLVFVLGLAGQIAQLTGMYAATRSRRIVWAGLIGIHIEGPLMLIGGIVAGGAVVFVERRMRHP
jgi:hypothetical protein